MACKRFGHENFNGPKPSNAKRGQIASRKKATNASWNLTWKMRDYNISCEPRTTSRDDVSNQDISLELTRFTTFERTTQQVPRRKSSGGKSICLIDITGSHSTDSLRPGCQHELLLSNAGLNRSFHLPHPPCQSNQTADAGGTSGGH
jgi:hypothetical protein